MEKTIKDLANEALLVQDACNLSGIVHSFSRAITRLRELYPDKGTEFYNTHPVCVLFSDKIASLTGSDSSSAFEKAYEECKELSKGTNLEGNN